MKKALIFLTLFFNFKYSFSQKEIDLQLNKELIGVQPHLLSVFVSDNKVGVKYLCFPSCIVRSTDEATMNGKVLVANSIGSIKGYVELADAVIILITQTLDPATNTFSVVQKDIIAVRDVDPSKSYEISLEGIDNKCKHIYERKEVPFNKYNFSTIKNLNSYELKSIEKILKSFEGKNSAKDFDINSFDKQNPESYRADHFSNNNLNTNLPEEEKVLQHNFLDDGVDYIVTRDKRVKKDSGEVYKTYFNFAQKGLVRCDSVFYKDRSENEFPDRVFNIDQNKYSGLLTRLSCEPLQSNIKLKYFRYSYIDTDKHVKRFRFQTENGKLNSFSAEKTFKLGDTIIHVSRRKNNYQSSVFMNDTVKLRFPLDDNNTLKYGSVFCKNLPPGPQSFFGYDDHIFMNEKQNDLILIGEQSSLTKSHVGIVPIGHPEANIKGYALTKLYVIKNNAVQSISRISVPYFSNNVSTYTVIKKDSEKGIYLLNMSAPVFLIVDNKGNVQLKDASKPDHVFAENPLYKQGFYIVNGIIYGCFRETNGAKIKLIELSI